jgi:Tfp pilus assembly protein PilO
MAGALADFSRRSLQYKVAVFTGAGVLLGLVYWQFMLSPLIDERDAANEELENQKGEQARLKDQKKRYDDLVADEARLRAEIEQNQKALPTEAEMPAFFDTLSRKTGEAGIELLKREIKPDVIIDALGSGPAPGKAAAPAAAGTATFIKVPVEIEVVGSFYQIKKFLSSLRPKRNTASAADPDAVQEKDRLVTIEALTVTDPKVKNNEIVLTARFTASTFRAKPAETPALPAAPGGAAAPARPPGPGAAAAPAKPGVAARPSTMKAKTEGAMDASEERTRNAAESAGEKVMRDSSSGSGSGVDRVKGGM